MSHGRKTWFITGASSGFGRAFAAHALDRGYNVVAAARNLTKLQDLVKQAPERVLSVKLDVDRSGDARKAIDEAVARFGRIDIVINNAGYGAVGAVEETPEMELRAIMETNFFGAMAMIHAALPILRAQGGGAIVNISSMGGQLSFAGFGAIRHPSSRRRAHRKPSPRKSRPSASRC
jgi:NAD(P)-dependent dehydrogenase (short-subunit alcohol dehydrogenase family)